MADYSVTGELSIDASGATESIEIAKKGIIALQKEMNKGAEELQTLTKKFEQGEISIATYNAEVAKTKKAMEEADKAMANYAKTQETAKAGSDSLSRAFGELLPGNIKKALSAFKDIQKNIDMKNPIASVKQFGGTIVTGLTAGVKAAVQFGAAIVAATGGLILIAGAIAGIIIALAKIVKGQIAYNEKVKEQNGYYDVAKGRLGLINGEIDKQTGKVKESVLAAQAMGAMFENINKWIADKINPALKKMQEDWEGLSEVVIEFMVTMGWITREQLEQRKLDKEKKNVDAEKKAAQDAYYNALNKSVLLGKEDLEKDKDKLSAITTYIDRLADMILAGKDYNGQLQTELNSLLAMKKILEASIAAAEKQVPPKQKLTDLTERIRDTELEILKVKNQQDDAVQSIEDKYAQMEAEAEAEYKIEVAKIKALENVNEAQRAVLLAKVEELHEQQKILREVQKQEEIAKRAEEEQIRLREELLAQLEAYAKEDERVARVEDEIDRLLISELEAQAALELSKGNSEKADELSRQAIQKQRDLVLEQIKARKDLTEAEKARFLVIQQAIWALEDETKKSKESRKEAVEGAKTQLNTVIQIATAATQVVAAIGGAVTGIMSYKVDETIEQINERLELETQIIDDWLEEENELLEQQRNAALEAAGFVAATQEASLEEAMQAAIDTQDAKIIYAEQRRQQQLAINKKYDDLEKQAAEKAETEKKAREKAAAEEAAELQYQVAMAEWQLKLSQAWMNVPVSAASAFAANASIPWLGALMAALAFATATANAVLVQSTPPRKAKVKFAEGAAFEGGVLSRPTTFKFADGGVVKEGEAGEAGNEGLLALERMSNGVLGVNASNINTQEAGLWVPFTDFTRAVVNCANDLGLVMAREV